MTLTGVRHRLEFALVRVVTAIVAVLPDPVYRAIGAGIGLVFYAVDAPHRRVAIRQLQAAFPVRSEAECRSIARQTFIHFGRLLVAILKFGTLDAAGVRVRLEFEGDDRIRTAHAAGKGVIIFSGHFGYWELQALGHPLALSPMSILARRLDNPYLHALLERVRASTGNRVIYRQGGMRRVLRALHANECVGILIDQHVHGADAVTVDFFDRPVATTSALAALALRTGAPLIPVFALPLPDGRYRLLYDHPVELPAPGSADPVRELTQRCTDVLEMYVRRYPHLWLWMHRRWRDRDQQDEGETEMFPAAHDESERMD